MNEPNRCTLGEREGENRTLKLRKQQSNKTATAKGQLNSVILLAPQNLPKGTVTGVLKRAV